MRNQIRCAQIFITWNNMRNLTLMVMCYFERNNCNESGSRISQALIRCISAFFKFIINVWYTFWSVQTMVLESQWNSSIYLELSNVSWVTDEVDHLSGHQHKSPSTRHERSTRWCMSYLLGPFEEWFRSFPNCLWPRISFLVYQASSTRATSLSHVPSTIWWS